MRRSDNISVRGRFEDVRVTLGNIEKLRAVVRLEVVGREVFGEGERRVGQLFHRRFIDGGGLKREFIRMTRKMQLEKRGKQVRNRCMYL